MAEGRPRHPRDSKVAGAVEGMKMTQARPQGQLQELLRTCITVEHGGRGLKRMSNKRHTKSQRDWHPQGDRNFHGDWNPTHSTHPTVFARDEEHFTKLEDVQGPHNLDALLNSFARSIQHASTRMG